MTEYVHSAAGPTRCVAEQADCVQLGQESEAKQ